LTSNPVSIIQQFLHPPIGLCVQEALPGNPYPDGIHALQRIRGPVNVDAFGLRWLIASSPPGYGIDIGAAVNFFDRTILQIGVQHRLFDGTIVTTQQLDTRLAQGHVMFDESFPYVVDVQLPPGVTADFWWLLVL